MECSREKAVEVLGEQLQGLEEAICAAGAELQVIRHTTPVHIIMSHLVTIIWDGACSVTQWTST